MEKYVAFDFELANASPTSICSIGAVLVENNQIVSTYYSLVKPVPFQMIRGSYRIHRIPLKRLASEKSFRKVWNEIKEWFEGATIISHDVFQDSRSLRATLDYYHIPFPNCKMSCSFVLSKRLLPDLPSHKLSDIGTYFQFPFSPHQALDDALLTWSLIEKMKEIYQVETVEELNQLAKFKYGFMKPNFYSNVYITELTHEIDYDMAHPVYENCYCIENSHPEVVEAISTYIKEHGGYVQKKVNTSTNYLISESIEETKNFIEAKRLINKGQDLSIITLQDFNYYFR